MGFPNVYAQVDLPKITTTIPPIASMVKMLVGNMGHVTYVQKSSSCPHHHSTKPSEVFDINTSDFLIYIDDNFESYIKKTLKSSDVKKLKLSSKLEIKNKNFHIWVDPKVAIEIMKAIKEFLIESKNFDREILESNYLMAKSQILEITKITPSNKILLIGDSLEYIKNDYNSENVDFFGNVRGIRKFSELEKLANLGNYKCIFFDEENDITSLKINENIKVKKLAIEHWHLDEIRIEEFYLEYLKKIHKKLSKC